MTEHLVMKKHITQERKREREGETERDREKTRERRGEDLSEPERKTEDALQRMLYREYG